MEQFEKDLVGLGVARYPIDIDTRLGQEQSVPVTQHDGFSDGAVLVLLEDELAKARVRLLAVFRGLDARHVVARPDGIVPGGVPGQAGSSVDASKTGMGNESDRAICDYRNSGKQADELAHLRAVDFIAGKYVGRRCNHDHLWLDVTGGFEQLLVAIGGLDLAIARRGAEHGIVTGQRYQMQPTFDCVGKRRPIMAQDCSKADVQRFDVLFRIDKKRRPRRRQDTQPIAAERVRGSELQLQDAFSNGAFAGGEDCLAQWVAVRNRPFVFRDRLVVPVRHVDEWKWSPCRWWGLCRWGLPGQVEWRFSCSEMRAALAVLRAGGSDRFAAGPANTLLFVLPVLALPKFLGLLEDVARMLIAKLVRQLIAIDQEHRAQRGQVPLRLVKITPAGVMGLTQPTTLLLDGSKG